MGAEGAGLATALGQVLAICILVSHFFSRQNGLKFVRPKAFFRKASAVFIAGFSVFVVDLAMGILTMPVSYTHLFLQLYGSLKF